MNLAEGVLCQICKIHHIDDCLDFVFDHVVNQAEESAAMQLTLIKDDLEKEFKSRILYNFMLVLVLSSIQQVTLPA